MQIKERGCLSLSTLIAYISMDIFAIVYLTRVHQDWSIWMNNLVDCCMVTSLLTLVLYYESGPGRKKSATGEESAGLINDSPDISVGER
jgi:hypothetical protein